MTDSQLLLLQAGQHLILPGSLHEAEAHQFITHASVLFNAELSEIRLVFGQDPLLALASNGYYAALVRNSKNSVEPANGSMEILIRGSGRTGKELAETKRAAIRQLAMDMEHEVVKILKEKDEAKEGRKRQRQTG
ncbi:hypothetical protein W97_08835 [Coniosporium apollinis CBS 100218]|uniref:Uncharacterized protein n=1 Tax=Coniosporium apollinis (strain CBS 100218) TaxID=1168221 RepID=R7Z5X1_CONA1|nr:uncharacterized protein W97_08835 [Coniosporium apollinis CBS 100218]EON69575.1 hypothetical protein W97_08835 [Coniosporium apollinis CBS 100218]